MRSKDNPDKHAEFKRIFVKVVEDYVKDPSDRKQAKLKQFVSESIQRDPELLLWFNVMFKWRNTNFGLDVDFKYKPELPN
jgi:hypothetical protein|tara:strand:- start:1608 stop:1847 length:240 start_codon:yes stop_codon:yes gene_type:complete